MSLTLFNSLTRSKEPFSPIDAKNVRMYVCGPTVYDYAHIGNARPAIVFDVLFRLLRHLYGKDHVTYVRNITDVDDKINARARQDHPNLDLNAAIREVTERTAAQYHKDVDALGCLRPTVEPRATENIEQMIVLVQKLLDQRHAYVARGGEGREVLFDVHSMPDYGALSQRNLDAQIAGARVAVEDQKRNPEDFVLWKESNASEPGWDATFEISDENREELGLNSTTLSIHGRPGWHLECSAMSERYLWTEIEGRISDKGRAHPHQFDIHGGGIDLIFPHHENELAQTRCAFGGDVMANVWMHNGFLQVEGQKMSKSLGNFITIHELLETEKFGGQKWSGPVLRLAMLMTQYREPIDFTKLRLLEAHAKLNDWMQIARRFVPEEGEIATSVIDALSDDLNTAELRLAIDQLALSARLTSGDRQVKTEAGSNLAATLIWLGLADNEKFDKARNTRADIRQTVIDAFDKVEFLESIGVSKTLVDDKITARLAARAAKDWAEADRIRDELTAMGIQLMDAKDPVTGEIVTTWEVKR